MTWALATIAVLLIGYATMSRRLERLNVSGAMFFTTAGLLVGPVLGLLDLQVRGEQVLFADASRISLAKPALGPHSRGEAVALELGPGQAQSADALRGARRTTTVDPRYCSVWGTYWWGSLRNPSWAASAATSSADTRSSCTTTSWDS
jgi:hypothetical protein